MQRWHGAVDRRSQHVVPLLADRGQAVHGVGVLGPLWAPTSFCAPGGARKSSSMPSTNATSSALRSVRGRPSAFNFDSCARGAVHLPGGLVAPLMSRRICLSLNHGTDLTSTGRYPEASTTMRPRESDARSAIDMTRSEDRVR